jgi:solute carrier family 25 carnitine/acylcarnitine transporter 20/29
MNDNNSDVQRRMTRRMTSKKQQQQHQPYLQDKSYPRDKEQSQQQQEIKKGELSSIGSNTSDDNINTNNTNANLKPMHDLIAGGVAGSVSVIVGHPFDTIKVNMQAEANNTNCSKFNYHYTLSNIQSLYRGVAAPLSTAAVFNAVVFASFGSFTRLWEHTFEKTKKDTDEYNPMDIHNQQRLGGTEGFESLRGEALHAERRRQQQQQQQQDQPSNRQDVSSLDTDKQRQQQSQHSTKIFLCGMAAGMVQSIFLCPMEHIKCRVQVDTTHKYRGTAHACYSILQEHGIKALNRGMGATLCREVPSFGMYFVSYDIVKVYIEKTLQQMNKNNSISSNIAAANNNEHAHAYIASALAGGISGVLAWLVTYPFDVIKTHIQTSPLKLPSKGTWAVGRKLVQNHGWKYMFRGLGVCLFTAVPVNAVIFPTYEYVLELLEGDD